MDGISNQTSSGSSNPPLRLFKDSWKSLANKQKFQLIIVFALVLGLPTILGGVYAVKLLRSGAATPPTTISPPAPAPTSTPTGLPVINTSSLPQIYWNVPYTAVIDAYDVSPTTLNMSLSTLPRGLSLKDCKRYSSAKTRRAIISCTLSGIPATADLNYVENTIFTLNIKVSNGKAAVTKEVKVPVWTVATSTPQPSPKPTIQPISPGFTITR